MSTHNLALGRQTLGLADAAQTPDYSYVFGTRGEARRHDPQVRKQSVQSPVDMRAISDLIRNRETAEPNRG